MVGETVHGYRIQRIRQTLDHVTGFEAVLAVAVRREPPGSDIETEWVVIGFGDFVTDGSYILKRVKQPGADPTGIVKDISPLPKTILRGALLQIVAMEAEHTALRWIAIEVQIRVREQKRGYVTCANIPCRFCLANRGGGGVARESRGKEPPEESVDVDQNKRATRSVGVDSKPIGAPNQHHSARLLYAWPQ